MANYNYGGYPYGNFYQPTMPQINQQQPSFNQMYQQNQPQSAQCVFVNGLEGAKAYQMIPNQTVMLMDSENPILYMKTSNGMGQSTLKYYKLVETSEQELKSQNAPQPNVNTNIEYALKSDLEALSKKIDEISSKFEKPVKEGETNE